MTPSRQAANQGCIFLSYRRSDSAGYAGRVGDRLRREFGKRRLFRDIEGIDPGRNFVEAIEHAVGSCAVLIALIGPGWADARDKNGKRRLDDPKDFVLLEIREALKRKIPVIPLLVGGATLPKPGEVPDELSRLLEHESHELTEKRWAYDLNQLVAHVRGILDPGWRKKRIAMIMVAATLIVAAFVAGALLLLTHFGPPPIPRLAVVDPSDGSGDQRYSATAVEIGDTLGAGLGIPKRLNIVPADEVLRALDEISIAPDACAKRVDPGPLRDMLAAAYIVFGNLRMGSAPNMLHVQLCLKDSFGNLISNKESEVAENGIQAFVADAAKQFRGAIGDAGAGAIPDLRGIYPEDAEARRLYFEGVSELRKLNARDAIQSLQKAAAREDSNALIHAALADSWEALRHDEEASIEAKAAIDHANQPSAFPLPIEYRDGINARAAEINRDWKQAITNYESLYRSFPQRIDYGLKLASVKTAGSEGQSALDTLKELTKLPLPLGKDPRIFIEQSRTYEALGDSSGAVKAAETAVHLAEDRKWHVLSGMALLQLCRAHHELADTNPESDCGKAQKIFEVFGNEVLAAVALNDMAVWLTDQGRYDEARAIYGRVRKITGDAGSKMDSAGALVNLARTYIFQEQPEKAEPLLKDSLAISTASDVKDQYDEALARQSLAHIYWEAGRIVDSGEQASQALDLARKIGDRSVEAFALGALALAQSETGDLRGALENYGQCLKIRQTLQQQAEITIAWTRLGDVNFRMGNFDAADGYYGDALKSFQEQGSANAVQMQVNLAHVDLERNKFPEAGSEAEAALTAMDKDDKESRADGLSFLVRALLGQKNLSAAEERHKEMKDLPVSDLEVVTDVGIADGEFLSASGRADEAAKQLKDSAEQLEKSGRRFSALQLQLAETAALAKAGKRREAASLLHQLREAAGQCTANLTPRPRCGFDLISQKAAAIQKSLRL